MKKNMIISIVVSLALIGGTLYFISEKPPTPRAGGLVDVTPVEIRNGVQYVTILAKGGYFPRTTEARGGIPTKLIVKTNDTYDCSLSLVIRSIGFQNILPSNGEEVIDLGTPKVGEKIQGVCGMGMYYFDINFSQN